MTGAWFPAAAALCGPGERLLAAEAAEPAGGVAPAPPAPAGGAPLNRSGKVGNVLLHLLSPNVSLPGQGRLDGLLFGMGAGGRPGSRAGDLFSTHLHTSGIRTTVIAVTSHRLLVCVTPERRLLSLQDESTDRLEPLWSVARTEVAGAEVRRYRLRRRLRIAFTDESWAAFVLPLGESLDPLRRLAAALG